MVFVNKEDKDRADFHSVIAQLTERLGTGFVPLELPLGEERSFHGVADVLSEEALDYDAQSGDHRHGELPADIADEERLTHEAVVEEIVSGDDEQLERYLSGDEPSPSELERVLAQEMLAGLEFPVLCGSAETGVGVDRLLDYLCELGPSPADRPVTVVAGDTTVEVPADASAAPLVQVFKTVSDPFVGQLSYFKVVSGTVRTDDHLVNSRTGVEERLHGLFTVLGKLQQPVTELVAGEIGAVAKLSDSQAGDTLAAKGSPVRVPVPPAPNPVHAVAVRPATQNDDDKLNAALQRLEAEDPALRVEHRAATRQTVVLGTGETHVQVALERLARKFGVHVETEDVRVAYLETIAGTAEAEGKVKKQSGGHGQFAVANLRVSPGERGSGFQFVDSIVGGAIPRQYIPAVERGLDEAMANGGVFGFPVVDVRVECFDGKAHSVDSSEMAFRAAAAAGLKDAMTAAGAIVLEPIHAVTIDVPSDHQGDVLGDLSARRGRVQGTDLLADGTSRIEALVPESELARYAVVLRSLTAGRGRFSSVHDHYDVLPSHLVAAATATLESDHP
ncbi:MAG: elongation factor G [Ilumatobacteraceae bacterium]